MIETEFFFKFQDGKHLLNLREFERVMNGRVSNMVQNDFATMDENMIAAMSNDSVVTVFDRRQTMAKEKPPLRSLGKFQALAAFHKFR